MCRDSAAFLSNTDVTGVVCEAGVGQTGVRRVRAGVMTQVRACV